MCFHFHIDDKNLADYIKLRAGDDAIDVRWLEIDDNVDEFKDLYVGHRQLVVSALVDDRQKFGSTLDKVA